MPPPVNIPDSFEGYNLDAFCIPQHYENSLSSVLIPCGLIQDRIERLAQDIAVDVQDSFTALCVLKGGYKFFADLVDKIKQYLRYTDNCKSITISVDFIRLKSRQDDFCTGKISVIGLESLESLRNKNVLVVEDIIDTGFTIQKVIDILKDVGPKSIRVVSLLLKRTRQSFVYRPDYIGFVIPDRFVVGYALDYNEYFRDLNHICVMNEEGKKKYSKALQD